MRRDSEITRHLVKANWVFKRGGGSKHSVWACPCGKHLIVVASSPSDGRAGKNVIATMRRCQKGWSQ